MKPAEIEVLEIDLREFPNGTKCKTTNGVVCTKVSGNEKGVVWREGRSSHFTTTPLGGLEVGPGTPTVPKLVLTTLRLPKTAPNDTNLTCIPIGSRIRDCLGVWWQVIGRRWSGQDRWLQAETFEEQRITTPHGERMFGAGFGRFFDHTGAWIVHPTKKRRGPFHLRPDTLVIPLHQKRRIPGTTTVLDVSGASTHEPAAPFFDWRNVNW